MCDEWMNNVIVLAAEKDIVSGIFDSLINLCLSGSSIVLRFDISVDRCRPKSDGQIRCTDRLPLNGTERACECRSSAAILISTEYLSTRTVQVLNVNENFFHFMLMLI